MAVYFTLNIFTYYTRGFIFFMWISAAAEKITQPRKSVLLNAAYSVMCFFIVGILFFSGTSKIIDPVPMIETINQVPVLQRITESLPFGEVWWGFLPIVEIALAIMLLLKYKLQITLITISVLFLFFFLFAIYGTLIGLNID